MDSARKKTDKKLAEMEKHLSDIYSRAEKELEKKTADFWSAFERKDNAKKAKLDAGEITEEEYKKWRQNQLMTGKHWDEMTKTVSQEMLNADKTAAAYVNGKLPEIYSLNYNQLSTDTALKGYSFELVDASTVRNLATSDKTLLPYKYVDGKKVERWNTQKVNSEIMQGIIQGESVQKMAKRLGNVAGMEKASAIRNARTTTTSAENKGRLDSYHDAQKQGIILKKRWIATHDPRTREEHLELDGQIVDIDEPFSNSIGDIMYPGDPDADPANVYNCRCTMVSFVEGFVSPETGEVKELLTWEEAREEEPDTEGPMKGIRKLQEEETKVDSVVKAVNTRYGKGREYSENCANCVVAAEARQRGYDVVALERDFSKKSNVASFWYDNRVGKGSWTDSFKGIVNETLDANRKTQLANAISEKMIQYGNNSRAVVFIQWDGRNVGHYFNVTNDNGRIVFFDSQNGAIGKKVENYLKSVQPSKTRIFRTDDKPFTDFITKVVKKNG